jgi:hypothetical protein
VRLSNRTHSEVVSCIASGILTAHRPIRSDLPIPTDIRFRADLDNWIQAVQLVILDTPAGTAYVTKIEPNASSDDAHSDNGPRHYLPGRDDDRLRPGTVGAP